MIAEQKRELPAFHSLDFRGIGKVIIEPGSVPAVAVKVEEDLLSRVRTEVRDGVLVISIHWWFGSFFRIMDLQQLEVRVTAPSLAGIRMSGAGTLESAGCLAAQDLEVRLSGAGQMRLDLKGHKVSTRLSGAGGIRLSGEAEEQEIILTGAGSIDAEKLVSKRARVRSSGAGECRVSAIEALKVDLSGAGRVLYRGSPRVESRFRGVGSLEAIEQAK